MGDGDRGIARAGRPRESDATLSTLLLWIANKKLGGKGFGGVGSLHFCEPELLSDSAVGTWPLRIDLVFYYLFIFP